ncbi:hypothetical protein [Longispora albida]|uniref:hypothetical protein n=1 Tax=Longispora albida TaxID=203523 RepID=UPI0004760940|nr:hypothetical protein [Longispora albida]
MKALEVACDESGYEGEKLTGTTTDVFAHGAMSMARETAAGWLLELRKRIQSPATQYKANHLLRERHRRTLEWALGPAGPFAGAGQVFLIDKEFYLVQQIARLTGDCSEEETAIVYQAAARHPSRRAFLVAANDVLKTKGRPDGGDPVPVFTEIAGVLAADLRSRAMARLAESGTALAAFRERLAADPELLPPADPLIPAISRAVQYWSAGGGAVTIVHDRQTTLSRSPAKIAYLHAQYPGLAGVEYANPEVDERIQVVDMLAGVARKVAQDELRGHSDPGLSRLVRPYVDPGSVWADRASWARLTGT